jgi:YidC/Oxa1 family membrane protein insertase
MTDMQKSDEWKEIQAKYKGDKEGLQREQLKLYQKMGVNPLASCLPMLLQFPIMIGLYQAIIQALSVTPVQLLELSKHIYPFINASELIPINPNFLWMNLSQPDRLPLFGIGIPVLAVLVVVTQYLSTKIMQPPSTNPNDQSAQMAKSMNLTMPLFMGYIAYLYSSGLALYFLVGNLIYIAQYAMMGKVNWANLIPGRRETVEEPKIEPRRQANRPQANRPQAKKSGKKGK